MTNADKIRKMSDEELTALFCVIDLTKVVGEGFCTQAEWAARYNKGWLSEDANGSSKFWEHYNKVLSNVKNVLDEDHW